MTDPADVARRLVEGIETVIRGQRRAVELTCLAVLAGGHVLVEDLPGTGKTTLARTLARCLGGEFHRVQATADLMPAEITGSSVWDPGRHEFVFVPGPVFADVLLVDELNRTPPRTQSALLEVMAEGAVTVDGVRHPVSPTFVLVATQNPVDQHGTYPLPEGQLDRFAVRVRLDPLEEDAECQVVRDRLAGLGDEQASAILDQQSLAAVRAAVRGLHVSEPVLAHAVALIRETRTDPRLRTGAGPRATIALTRVAQAHAALRGRDYVTPDDVNTVAAPVLAHRVDGAGDGQAVILDLVRRRPVPVNA